MTLAVLHLRADPALVVPRATAAGAEVRLRIFSGLCVVGWENGKRSYFELGAPAPERLGFYVPDAGPLDASWSMNAWAELSMTQLVQPANQRSMHPVYGVDEVSVQLVDDAGHGGRWPYVWFVVLGGEPMQLRYRVTVTEPTG
ncbi:MAG TPA: hypothetical protein VFM09_12865 [Marmoricola sp.]|nr:hypothetical protein [Marmoricola sp.]